MNGKRSYLFNEACMSDILNDSKKMMAEEVDRMSDDYILNVSPTDLVDYLEDKYSFEVPSLLEDQIQIIDKQDVYRDVSDYGRQIQVLMQQITFAIPFSGNHSMFQFTPSTQYIGTKPTGKIMNMKEIHLTYAEKDLNPEAFRSQLKKDIEEISQCLQWLAEDVRQHNSNLCELGEQLIQKRRTRALASANLLTALNIPVRQREGKQPTFRAPEIARRIEIQRPIVKEQPFQPEPAINMTDYEDVLRALEQMIVCMERSPETFQSMGEEDLRNLLLMQLNVTYEGRATGETFNKNGKTDILIRDQGKNVFIAECKIWRGQSQYKEAIDQLLSYTCWLDTKTALLVFSRNRDHSNVLQQIEETTISHECCKKLLYPIKSGHLRFLFYQPGDQNREIYLSVMAFHIPN